MPLSLSASFLCYFFCWFFCCCLCCLLLLVAVTAVAVSVVPCSGCFCCSLSLLSFRLVTVPGNVTRHLVFTRRRFLVGTCLFVCYTLVVCFGLIFSFCFCDRHTSCVLVWLCVCTRTGFLGSLMCSCACVPVRLYKYWDSWYARAYVPVCLYKNWVSWSARVFVCLSVCTRTGFLGMRVLGCLYKNWDSWLFVCSGACVFLLELGFLACLRASVPVCSCLRLLYLLQLHLYKNWDSWVARMLVCSCVCRSLCSCLFDLPCSCFTSCRPLVTNFFVYTHCYISYVSRVMARYPLLLLHLSALLFYPCNKKKW